MTINYVTGDIFQSNDEALVNPVNCVGVMGAGLAKEFKKRYPGNFAEYKYACLHHMVRSGEMFLGFDGSSPIIINFPTKRHWREKSRQDDIRRGLIHLRSVIADLGIKSISIPALGCGLGGLDWAGVRLLIEKILGNLEDVQINVYEPTENS